jgi:hypothetical protein
MAVAAGATGGWRTWKPTGGGGTRLMPDGEDEHHTIQVREGYSGWKAGMRFIRIWNQDTAAYTLMVLNKEDDLVVMATGQKDHQVWTNAYAALRNKGYPAYEE